MDSLYVSDLLYCRALPGCDTIGNAVYGTSYVGMWRSLVARFVRDEEVAGSNPVIPTRNSNEPCGARFHFLGMTACEAGAGNACKDLNREVHRSAISSTSAVRVKACEATTQWLGLDAHELLSPTRNLNERAIRSLVLFPRDDMRAAGAGHAPLHLT